MSDRFWDEPEDEQPDKTESVRIIGAEEAAEALERGDVAPRRTGDEPRYGDRPASPSPGDAAPAVRFPLPADQADDLIRPRPAAPVMPHWADPPTGDVPTIIPEGSTGPGPGAGGDDIDAWSGFASGGPRWRGDQQGDWAEPDYDPAGMVHDDDSRVGALDDRQRPLDDLFSFDQPPGAARAADTARRPPGPRRPRPKTAAKARTAGLGGRDMQQAVLIGVGLVVAALVLFQLGPAWVVALAAVVVVVAAAELYSSLQGAGYQPATLVGLVASGGLVLATYWKGETAQPLVLTLAVVTTLLWYLLGVHTTSPTMNMGVTVLGFAYIGLLGSFAALILGLPNGLGILGGAVIAAVANDVGALVVGQSVGRAPIAPDVSPNKTIEGVLGGAAGSIVVSVIVYVAGGLHPWDSFGKVLALGAVVAVVAPLGDLCESLLKRDLGVKDMGNFLPGHGGVLDRFDGLLFVLPATYYLCRLLDVV